MRVDISGSWIYIYSGVPDANGLYGKVQCIHAGTITDLTVNQTMCSIRLGIGAREVHLEFLKAAEYLDAKKKRVGLFEGFGLTSGFVDVLQWSLPQASHYKPIDVDSLGM